MDDNNTFVNDLLTAPVDAKAVYIDSVDLNAFINTAAGFLKTSDGSGFTENTRLTYLTSNDVQLSCCYARFTNDWSFEINKVYQQLRTQVSGTFLVLNKKRMKEFVALLKLIQTN